MNYVIRLFARDGKVIDTLGNYYTITDAAKALSGLSLPETVKRTEIRTKGSIPKPQRKTIRHLEDYICSISPNKYISCMFSGELWALTDMNNAEDRLELVFTPNEDTDP